MRVRGQGQLDMQAQGCHGTHQADIQVGGGGGLAMVVVAVVAVIVVHVLARGEAALERPLSGDEDEELAGAGGGGVEKLATQKHGVCFVVQRHHHAGELPALRLVHGGGPGQLQLTQAGPSVAHHVGFVPSQQGREGHLHVEVLHFLLSTLFLLQVYCLDSAQVPVVDPGLIVVLQLHHPVVHTQHCQVCGALLAWVHDWLEGVVEGGSAHQVLLGGRQDLHVQPHVHSQLPYAAHHLPHHALHLVRGCVVLQQHQLCITAEKLRQGSHGWAVAHCHNSACARSRGGDSAAAAAIQRWEGVLQCVLQLLIRNLLHGGGGCTPHDL
mmetsp:Transcript_27695/g.60637  ORF Transcript_27695/g.60637 Transcript_27695/m.60637 type:complete len:325 (+) Transcript_27695:1497-2471(+)